MGQGVPGEKENEMSYRSIRPGKVWLDTNGGRIQAHAGSVFHKDGIYYWYGENKEKSVEGSAIWHWGVRCYASQDLYNWEDRGLLIPPESDDPNSPLYPSVCMDRPHILYNEKTKKYVCWLKIMEGGNRQSMTVLTADDFFGPYTIVRTGYHPFGFDSGDFDFAVDPQTNKGYYYFEKVHTELICAELSWDYTEVTGQYSSHFQRSHPPFVREAPVHFMRNGKHYLFTSGTTGYFPNESEVAIADDWHGPYKVLGNPHPKDRAKTSFRSQITDVLKVENTDLYIAIADRWLPKFPGSLFVTRMISRRFDRKYGADTGEKVKEEQSQLNQKPKKMNNSNTAFANYVWLPIRFEGELPVIDWKKEWRIEDYV
jgi:hypothetical protein